MKQSYCIIFAILIALNCTGCTTAELASTPTDIPQTTTPFPPTETPFLPTDTPVLPAETPTEAPIEFPSGKFYNSSFDSYVIINEDGTWRFLEGTNRTFFTGFYQVEKDQVTFTERSGVCSEFGDGVYRWNFSEAVLSIKPVNDDCKLRSARLTFPYTQQK